MRELRKVNEKKNHLELLGRLKKQLDNPALLRAFHAYATLLWIVVGVPITLIFPDSIFWVAMMSVWSNVVGHWGA